MVSSGLYEAILEVWRKDDDKEFLLDTVHSLWDLTFWEDAAYEVPC